MLRKKFKKDTTLSTNLLVNSEDASSDREFVFNKLLNAESVANINAIVDLESAEFKPEAEKVEVDLFFLRYIEDNAINDISGYLEDAFSGYHQRLIITQNTLIKSELFEVRASDGLPSIKFDNEVELSPNQINTEKPYVVIDPMVELRKKYPAKSGRPHFYNTFTFPFWDKKDQWSNLKYGFNNKTYTYGSFLLLEIFDDHNVETQKRITTIPIYVSDRYMFNEKTKVTETSGGVQQKRPVFNLIDGVDGYSFFFLKNYIKSDFYVKFYFWDALNGKKIQFIPSSKTNTSKKWLQDVETFDQKRLYLKYELDYTKKTYRMFDFNDRTGDYDIETEHIDLYEFGYDDYWSQFPVLNDQPTDLQVPTDPRVYGDLLLSTTSISRTISLTDVKFETLIEGVKADENYQDVKVEFESEQEWRDEYTYQLYKTIINNDVTGSPEGYLNTISNSLGIKPIGLLNTKSNKCVNIEIESFKRTVGSFRLENRQDISNYIINDMVLSNFVVKSNEPTINLTVYGSLQHNIGSALYTEYCVVPRKSLTETYDYYYTTFSTAWDDYVSENEVIEIGYNSITGAEIYPEQTTPTYAALINNPTHQINYANMVANKSYLQTGPRPDITNYSAADINSLLKTKPDIKKDGITLVIESLDPKINTNEEIIVTIDLVIGSGALFNFGMIKELEITALLELNVYKEDIGISDMKKITIPVKINLK
jgi:hypothetical protein